MSSKSFDYVIIGAGFAGLATAYYLLKKNAGTVCLIEKEPEPALAASGRNASMICQIVRDRTLSKLMLTSTKIIKEEWLKEFPSIQFRECGSLHIGREKDISGLSDSSLLAEGEFGISLERLNRGEALKRFPCLSKAIFREALYCPTDGIIDTKEMAKSLLGFVREKGALFIPSTKVAPERSREGSFVIHLLGDEKIESRVLINAAGAWAGEVAASLGAQDFPIKPLCRHIFVSNTNPLDENISGWPIVWDIPNGIYFRPEGESLMLSPCDEVLVEPGPTFVDPKMKDLLEQKLVMFLPQILGTRFIRSWSGIRTFSPDRRFVIGWDDKVTNFYWVACLGGYGVTSAAAAGKLAAAMLLDEDVEPEFEELLSPKRFSQQECFV